MENQISLQRNMGSVEEKDDSRYAQMISMPSHPNLMEPPRSLQVSKKLFYLHLIL